MSLESSWERVKTTVEDHPYIVLGVIAVVALYFLWPSSSGSTAGSSITASEEASIAAASQANEQLSATQIQSQTDMALAQDQLQATNQQTAAAQAISAQNDNAAVSLATIGSQTQQAQDAAAVSLGGLASNSQWLTGQQVLSSQNSAEGFLTNLEAHGLSAPTVNTAGLTASAVSDPSGSIALGQAAINADTSKTLASISGLLNLFGEGTAAAGSTYANNLGGQNTSLIASAGNLNAPAPASPLTTLQRGLAAGVLPPGAYTEDVQALGF